MLTIKSLILGKFRRPQSAPKSFSSPATGAVPNPAQKRAEQSRILIAALGERWACHPANSPKRRVAPSRPEFLKRK